MSLFSKSKNRIRELFCVNGVHWIDRRGAMRRIVKLASDSFTPSTTANRRWVPGLSAEKRFAHRSQDAYPPRYFKQAINQSILLTFPSIEMTLDTWLCNRGFRSSIPFDYHAVGPRQSKESVPRTVLTFLLNIPQSNGV
jgi:hypothetical protein